MGLYIIPAGAEVALPVVNTLKGMLGVKAGTEFGLVLRGFTFDLDGVDADAQPVEVAIAHCTFATNAPGTASQPATEIVANGRRAATGIAGGYDWSSIPTVIGGNVFRGRMDSNKLVIDKDIPLLDQPDTDLAAGFLVTAFIETGDPVPTATFKGELRVGRC